MGRPKLNPPDGPCEVVITADNDEWLATFAHQLVARGYAASCHLIPMRSIYRWRGEIYDKHETRASLHTRASLVTSIVEQTLDQHPYETPCVVALPITAGNPAYVAWINDETQAPTTETP